MEGVQAGRVGLEDWDLNDEAECKATLLDSRSKFDRSEEYKRLPGNVVVNIVPIVCMVS